MYNLGRNFSIDKFFYAKLLLDGINMEQTNNLSMTFGDGLNLCVTKEIVEHGNIQDNLLQLYTFNQFQIAHVRWDIGWVYGSFSSAFGTPRRRIVHTQVLWFTITEQIEYYSAVSFYVWVIAQIFPVNRKGWRKHWVGQ